MVSLKRILTLSLLTILLAACGSNEKQVEPSQRDTLRKIVLKTDSQQATKTVDLKLVINHGSLSEQDNEKGFAHLVEHLAFNDTAKYPNETLIPLMEKSGMSLGVHSNAHTGYDQTVYKLNLKDPDEKRLELAIDVLAQWAMHVQFNQEVIDAEKPVVKEEWRGYQPKEDGWRMQFFKAEYANSHYLNRRPIGDMSIIEAATAKALEAFYKRWYQPHNASVIVTGDIDPKQVNALIDEYFGEWERTEKPAKTSYAMSITSIPQTTIISDANITSSFAAINYYLPFPQAKSVDGRYQGLIAKVGLDILERRIKERLQETKGAVQSVSTFASYPSPETLKVEFVTNMSGGDIEVGLKLLTREINQFLQQGISQTELDSWRAGVLKQLRLYQERPGDLSNSAVDHVLYGSPLLTHAAWLAVLEKRLPSLSVQQVNEAVHQQLSGQQAKLLVVHNPSITPPAEPALSALLDGITIPKAVPTKVQESRRRMHGRYRQRSVESLFELNDMIMD